MLHLRVSLLIGLLLWFQRLASVRALVTADNGCNLFFCMNITVVDKEMMTFELTPVFEPFGYLGLGFGGRMLNTHMIVVWEGDNGSPVLSQRYGVGHVEPVVEAHPERVASLIPSTVNLRNKSNYSTIAFNIPYNKTETRPGRIIWAYSLVKPDPHPSAELTSHYVAGTVNMKLDKVLPGSSSPSKPTLEIQEPEEDMFDPLPRVQKLIWHGIFLSVGFLVLLPAGSLVARWSRTFTPRWFKIHRLINFGIALPVISCGFVLGPLAVSNRQASHFADAHQICGALLFALYIAQLFLGRYIHARKKALPERAPHPPSNILHILLGISVVTFAFFQVNSGFKEWAKRTGQLDVSRWCHDLFFLWTLLLPVLYFGGLVLLRRQFAQENSTYGSPGPKNYIALAANAPSPIMFDADHDIPGYSELETGVPLLHRDSRPS